jgi:S1-C subfamily serine protease
MRSGSYKPGVRLSKRTRLRLERGFARVACSALLVAACCGAALAQVAVAPAASTRQRKEVQAPSPAQPPAPRVVVIEAAPRNPVEASPRIPSSTPPAPAAVAQGRRPAAPAPKPAPMPPREIVTVVHRLSGWKLLIWLATSGPSTMQLDSLPSTEDAHTNIVAGYVYEDGRTVVARLPQSEVEVESLPGPPPGFLVATNAARAEQPEFTLITADNKRIAAKFIGLDAATGLSMLEAAQPILSGPAGDTGDTEDPTVGQRVHLYAPAPAPVAQVLPRAGDGYILLNIDQREGRLTEVRRAPSGKPFSVTASVSVTPDWTGAVAANEAGEVVGIVSQGGAGETQIVPVAAVHSACDRVLKLRGSAPRPWLGVRGEAASQAPRSIWETPGLSPEAAPPMSLKGRQGVVLTSVAPGTPAARAGLLPGDVIARVGTRDVRSVEDLSVTLDEEGVGSTVEFTVLRALTPLKLNVQLQGAQNPALATALSEERAAREALLSLRREFRTIQAQAVGTGGALPAVNAAALAQVSERMREAEKQFDRVLPRVAEAETRATMSRGFAAAGIPGQPFAPFEPAQAFTPLPAFGLHAIALTGRSAARLNARGGMLVVAVRPESPAALSGLRVGDVIETVNGADFNRLELRRLTAFDATPITLGVVRDGHTMTLTFSLAGDEERQK